MSYPLAATIVFSPRQKRNTMNDVNNELMRKMTFSCVSNLNF